jgi:hypothetical protein
MNQGRVHRWSAARLCAGRVVPTRPAAARRSDAGAAAAAAAAAGGEGQGGQGQER